MEKKEKAKQLIELQNVKFSYSQDDDPGQEALKDISLGISRGEFLAVIGKNGSGKSTLAKLLNGLLLPSQGRVLVDNLDTSISDQIWHIRQKAGMVFQNPDNQIVATTVEEDVAFGLENLGVSPDLMKARIAEALKIVGMEQYRDYPPHLLSGGQKQRVAISGIIAMRPEVLILDEPTAMLDPRGRNEVVKTVLKLNQEEKITVVYVTHFMEEVVKADRVIIMDEGQIKYTGTPEEIFSLVDELKETGLEAPQIVELCHELRKEGVEIPNNVLTVESLVRMLC
ncbi:energy-coupling factor transporter ATPase [Natranaerobius thermophilus]|uniref:ABC transporter related n=1 Tax=Natranaerobius thermophilus (strain ATCC BAA-1301 / DSM 18059 / JW/NM-WN-LF) TaxID=457570 RepID=B2A4Q2_NATTJ|nr:energy-coupling factor transporter ATPase [Natranaerobius thermophilus]ACB83824.1 ABC transporter related [Natranaerobius thermophilus JW/NM-WN-LF]